MSTLKLKKKKKVGKHKHHKLRGKQAQQHCSPGEAFAFLLFSLVCILVLFSCGVQPIFALLALFKIPPAIPCCALFPKCLCIYFQMNFSTTICCFCISAKQISVGLVWGRERHLRRFVLSCSQPAFSLNSLSSALCQRHADQRKTHFN